MHSFFFIKETIHRSGKMSISSNKAVKGTVNKKYLHLTKFLFKFRINVEVYILQ